MSVRGASWLPAICRCVALVAAMIVASALAGTVRADGPRPPNIVFFLCDDLGAGDVAALGSRDIRTPEIDGLFARGTRLTRHWSGNAVCAPSRCVLMTGMHPGHAVVRSNREAKPEGQAPMPPGTVTLARLLRDAGYATGGFGKWGLGGPGSASDPQACGFDRFFGYNCQREAHSYYPDHLWDDRERFPLDNGTVPRRGTVPAEPPPTAAAFAAFSGRHYAPDLIAARQLAFIRENAARPFFLYVPTTVPHVALQVPADEPSLPEYHSRFGAERAYLGGSGYVPCERPLATYAAMVTRMDREVGRIVRLLEELKLSDDTIFVFTSDNGAAAPGTGGVDTARFDSHRGLRDWKGSPYEGGLRVPAVAVWPGRIPAGGAIDAPTGFEDWMPTLLDLAGLHDRIPAGIDGVSLAAALCGTAAPPARPLYRELTERQWQAAVDGPWKVVRRGRAKRQADEPHATELYDLAADPAESQDVAGDHPEIVGRMEAFLDREHVPHPDWPMPFADHRSRANQQGATRPAPASRPPSVLVILSDDQRADTIGALGNPHLRTPAVDALVARGTVFDRAYCMGSMNPAVCVPSRAMMLSGRSLFHIDEQLRGCDTWPEAFGRAGYRTFLTGKWHNGAASAARCFAEGRNVFLGGMHNQLGVPVVAFTDHGQPAKVESGRTHSSELFGGAAEAFVQSLGDEPFFAWVAFTAPHDPRQPPPGFRERFAGHEPPPPENFLPEHPFDNGELKVRDEKLLGWPRTRERISAELADYYACIEGMDAQIARVVAALETKGRLDDTIILFTSDHGLALGSHGLLGKQNVYEHSMRPPAVVAGPGVPAGKRVDALCYLHDLTATVGDLAGVPAPDKGEGRSLVPVLRDRQPGVRDALLLAYRNVQRALVTPEWKLIAYPAAHKTQLFDLAKDSAERADRADDPTEAARRADLESRLVAARKAADDPLPVEQPAAQPPGTASSPSAAALPPGGRPNIVLIMADDFGYECVGANGGESYRTPHLDRLAATGARFEQCHVLPLCTPTRVELMTGRSNVRNYVKFGQLPRSETTFAHLLKQAGYATGICGKWQLGQEPDAPRHFGFDESYLWQHTRRPPRYANPGLEIDGVERDFRGGEYGPTLVNDFAVDFVTRHKDHPFLLYYPMMLTHGPFQPTPDSPAWDPTARGEKAGRDPAHFGAMVECMDQLIGRLVARLDELGIRDNTLLVFLGDNGTAPAITSRFNGAEYRGGKGSTTMRGTHVPLFVNWPAGGRAGLVTADLVGAVDVLPTLCEAAGAAVPDGTDGRSFLPQVRGERGTPREWLYSWYSPRLGPGRKVSEYAFDQRYKLYRTGEFFDLGADPDERSPIPIESLPPQAVEAARTLSAALDRFVAARPSGLDRAGRAAASSSEPTDE